MCVSLHGLTHKALKKKGTAIRIGEIHAIIEFNCKSNFTRFRAEMFLIDEFLPL